MRGLLHPVGPESPRTYWLRRLVVLGVTLFLLAMIGLGINALTRDTTGASPSEPAAVQPQVGLALHAAPGQNLAPSGRGSSYSVSAIQDRASRMALARRSPTPSTDCRSPREAAKISCNDPKWSSTRSET